MRYPPSAADSNKEAHTNSTLFAIWEIGVLTRMLWAGFFLLLFFIEV